MGHEERTLELTQHAPIGDVRKQAVCARLASVSRCCCDCRIWQAVLSAVSAMMYSLELDYRVWEGITFGVGGNPHTAA